MVSASTILLPLHLADLDGNAHVETIKLFELRSNCGINIPPSYKDIRRDEVPSPSPSHFKIALRFSGCPSTYLSFLDYDKTVDAQILYLLIPYHPLEIFLLTLTTFDLTNEGSSIPSLYIDLEGSKLSRYGTISLLTLFLFPNNSTYLIDITTLGTLAFTTASPTHPDTTFKLILEDASISKVFFDVRNDSDALYSHFQISLAGIIDLQLLELGSRTDGLDHKRTVRGLARCIKTHAQLTPAEKEKLGSSEG
ncbi:hypothetical protein ONS95_010572 [Cadophora gregata]|uniref:uncharacterized protein n=1 Tax=Cadophora gregata TaxID=51156 RepID=UPI0026DB44D4|nr:uncharacterized protein ONS95_010572 [Cadophora gregata]KAK0122330.1 hypothetical protein ONS95_010572 [Cadophora gregata]